MGQIQVRVLEHFVFWEEKINLLLMDGCLFQDTWQPTVTLQSSSILFLKALPCVTCGSECSTCGEIGIPSTTHCCLVINYWWLSWSKSTAFLVRCSSLVMIPSHSFGLLLFSVCCNAGLTLITAFLCPLLALTPTEKKYKAKRKILRRVCWGFLHTPELWLPGELL